LLLASRLAFAQAGKDCSQPTMRELGEWYHRNYQRADAELNKLYRQLTERLADPSERELLQQAEQAWAHYRDIQCAFETAGARAVPIHPVVVSTCLWEKTRAHIEDLQHQLNCPDGDPTCIHHKKEGGG